MPPRKILRLVRAAVQIVRKRCLEFWALPPGTTRNYITHALLDDKPKPKTRYERLMSDDDPV